MDELSPAALQAAFAAQRSWQDKYRLLLTYGRTLPEQPGADFPADARLAGCESEAWLWLQGDQQLHCAIASPSRLVRGLLWVLCHPVQRATPQFVKTFDFAQYLADLGLLAHLSASRGNGLQAAITQLRAWADARLSS